jgi:hypothetical protein
MAQAICALDAAARWAVTGTPIQNRLSDLAALLKFLRAHPYNDRKQFDADFSRAWKSGGAEEAIRRLKCLSGCLILRRPKGTITLPPRRDLRCPVEFSTEERTLYQEIRNRAIERIDNLLLGSEDSTASYANVLQQIEAMRMVCNLGLQYHSRHHIPSVASVQQGNSPATWEDIAQQTFNTRRGISQIQCQNCDIVIDVNTSSVFDDPWAQTKQPLFSQCMKFICPECVANTQPVCGHNQPCPYTAVSLSPDTEESSDELQFQTNQPAGLELSGKVKRLIAQLKSLPEGTKRSVPARLTRP